MTLVYLFFWFFSHTFTFQRLDKPWSQVSSLLPPGSCLQFFLSRIGFSNPTARRFFRRVLLTHALALSASQFVLKKKSPQIYTSMHSAGLELTKLIYTSLEDNPIRHRCDRLYLGHPHHNVGISIGYIHSTFSFLQSCVLCFGWYWYLLDRVVCQANNLARQNWC